jgi:hypothetical protein
VYLNIEHRLTQILRFQPCTTILINRQHPRCRMVSCASVRNQLDVKHGPHLLRHSSLCFQDVRSRKSWTTIPDRCTAAPLKSQHRFQLPLVQPVVPTVAVSRGDHLPYKSQVSSSSTNASHIAMRMTVNTCILSLFVFVSRPGIIPPRQRHLHKVSMYIK